ncbi:hypothetical protein BD779DRAFT_1494107 [Infundibulicybe gibba]|nr:hypothetical protein BD779DRAFT_1494107 [Infundibulicybe gibba]
MPEFIELIIAGRFALCLFAMLGSSLHSASCSVTLPFERMPCPPTLPNWTLISCFLATCPASSSEIASSPYFTMPAESARHATNSGLTGTVSSTKRTPTSEILKLRCLFMALSWKCGCHGIRSAALSTGWA